MTLPIRQATNILITGAGGRIGRQVVTSLQSTGHTVYQIRSGASKTAKPNPLIHHELDPSSLTMSQWQQKMRENNIQIVLNLAAQSSGCPKAMEAVNVKMPQTIAKACEGLGIKMIHTCSYSAHLKGLTTEDHPYAATKQIAAKTLESEPHVVIARLGAVLGGQSDVPVISDAAVSKWSPVILLPAAGGEQVIHPVDEKTVVKAMQGIVEHLTDPAKESQPLPKVIDIAGQEVPLKAFLKMINPKALGSVKLPNIVLNLLSILVDKGVFTKEFMNIAKLISSRDSEQVKPDTTVMENVLGVITPSPEKVADAAREQLSLLQTTSIIAKSVLNKIINQIPSKAREPSWPANFLTQIKNVEGIAQGISKKPSNL